MVTQEQIRALSDDIVHKFQPEKVILFGSYAYGVPNENSDVDLLIVLPYEGRRAAKAIEIRNAIDATFSLDLLPYPDPYIRQRIEQGDFFMREIVLQGKVLYDAARDGMGRKSRR